MAVIWIIGRQVAGLTRIFLLLANLLVLYQTRTQAGQDSHASLSLAVTVTASICFDLYKNKPLRSLLNDVIEDQLMGIAMCVENHGLKQSFFKIMIWLNLLQALSFFLASHQFNKVIFLYVYYILFCNPMYS